MPFGLMARVRSLVNGIRNDLDADMQAEFAHHMELRARDLVRSGLSPENARRQARVEFGGAYNYKEAGREARGLRWFDAMRISWLDIKLGARMIYRYPGLTLVAGVAMGVAIALGAGVMSVIALMRDPKIPLDEGERIVGIQVWSVASFNAERRIAFDLATWKAELKTVRDLGAFRNAIARRRRERRQSRTWTRRGDERAQASASRASARSSDDISSTTTSGREHRWSSCSVTRSGAVASAPIRRSSARR